MTSHSVVLYAAGIPSHELVLMFRGRKVFDGRRPNDIAERTLAQNGVPAEGTLEMVLYASGSGEYAYSFVSFVQPHPFVALHFFSVLVASR